MVSQISQWFCPHAAQGVCSYDHKFALALPVGSAFASRPALSGRDAGTLAHELLAMSQPEFSTAFEEPLVRARSARALGRLGSLTAPAALRARWGVEVDVDVRAELEAALKAFVVP